MADHAGRGTSASAARLTALGLVVLALALGLRVGLGGSRAPGAGTAAAEEPAAQSSPAAPGVRLDEPGSAFRLPAEQEGPPPWNGRFAERIAHWKRQAERRSRGAAPAVRVRVAAHVVDLTSGVELVSLSADEPLRPASNLKLVTTAAALVLLGPRVDFLTPFEAAGPVDGGVLRGDLVVRASGDPLCAVDGDARIEHRLAEVARELRRSGVRRVAGDLVLDEGAFADPAPGPAWPDASQHWAEYCALAGGFSANGGVLSAEVTPRSPGAPALVAVHPRPHGLRSNYDVKTGGSRLDVRVGATSSSVTVKGRLPASQSDYTAEFAHPDPVALFGSVLEGALEENGVPIDGRVRRERDPPGGPRVAELRSPVEGTLVPINAESRNGVADQLFLALGWTVTGAGTRAGGRAAIARALEMLGVSDAELVQVDGSGLSRDNRITARQITTLIAGVLARDVETAELYRASLAVAGESGTLAERLRNTPAAGRVQGKTGWIAGTSSLSGLVETLDGRTLAFSILVDYPSRAGGLNRSCFKPMQDELVLLLVAEAP